MKATCQARTYFYYKCLTLGQTRQFGSRTSARTSGLLLGTVAAGVGGYGVYKYMKGVPVMETIQDRMIPSVSAAGPPESQPSVSYMYISFGTGWFPMSTAGPPESQPL